MKSANALILETKAYAKDFSLTSWWCILSTAFLLATAITGTFLHLPWAVKIICSLFAGLLSLRFFVIYHDQQHHAILSKSRLAEFIMRIFGLWALSPSSIWRASHNHHHKHNSKLRGSHIGSFPIMTKAQYLSSSKSDRFYYLFMRHPLTILFGYVFVFLYGMVIYPFINSPRKHYDCLLAFVLHITLGTLLVWFFGWPALFLALIIPLFIASAIGSYLFYAQHNFPDVSFSDNAGWTYEKAALESSSFMKTSRIMAWFTGNIGHHHIHHLNARVPFYRLPEVLKKIPELQNPKTTSLHPADIFRCLRLKVWDVETQRMVGLGNL
ncbi:MAG TPA: fatty acid desaturase [Verrucomicrobiae bacterium]|jgi:omega-6 fatty acid desaturase (delta-12 desaturase)